MEIKLHKRNRNGCFYRVVIASLQHNDKKDMKKEEIRAYLLSRDLMAMDLVRRSEGLIGLNQASGLVNKLRKGIDLSNTALTMVFVIAKYSEMLEEDANGKLKELGIDNTVPDIDKPRRDVYMPMGSIGLEKLNEELPNHKFSSIWVDTSEAVGRSSQFGYVPGNNNGSDSHKLNEIMRILQELRLELTSQKKQK